MCGIAGIIKFNNLSIQQHLLTNLSTALSKRGPDDLGFLGWDQNQPIRITRTPEELLGSKIALIHRRLSILDLSEAGSQPMCTSDGRYSIVFNGEIYNYLELRSELKALGHQFRSDSDTEVLLAAYVQWGSRCPTRLIGMFAFAVLDTYTRTLFLARDCFGIKPLYYIRLDSELIFASEIKALLKLDILERKVNAQRLYHYLNSGLTDYGHETLFLNIYQLPAAHYLKIYLDQPKDSEPVQYWSLELEEPVDISFEEATEKLRELFLQNVRLHLRSDVPIGSALSGGIDSSAIVSAIRYLEPKLELHTFSFIADDPNINEEYWIDLVGMAKNANIHKVQASPQELVDDLEHLIFTQDEPFGSTSIYAQYRVFRLAQEQGIKVMLDGQGADEVFGGYRSYITIHLMSLLAKGQWEQGIQLLYNSSKLPGTNLTTLSQEIGKFLLPTKLRGLAKKFLGKQYRSQWLNSKWFLENSEIAEFSLPKQPSDDFLRQELQQALTTTSLPMLLRYEDRNSMYFSIESRVPFLTPELVQFVFTLPEDYIISSSGVSKAIFRQAMRGIVPDAILDRKDKIGFATPEKQWLTTLRPWVEEVLNSETAYHIPALNIEQAKQDWQGIINGQQSFDFRVWRWVNLVRWVEHHNIKF